MAPEPGDSGVTDDVKWAIPTQPVTFERPPPVGLDNKISRPGLPRANQAPSAENPNPPSTEDLTVIEGHVSYFDFDNDGIIFPLDTWRGFHNIGFNWFLSIIAIFVIHGTFSYWTQPSWIPDPRFPLYIKKMYRCKHGSDSETYDTEGRYQPEKFEEVFSKYAKKHKDALSKSDIAAMIVGNRNVLDPTGWTASTLEWGALYWVAADERGLLTKERVRANYDGTLWYTLAREQTEKRKKQAAEKKRRSSQKNK